MITKENEERKRKEKGRWGRKEKVVNP